MSDNQPIQINRADIRKIVEHFKGGQVTNDALLEFCNLNKINPITEGEYADWLFQYNSDMRAATFIPAVLKLFAEKYQPIGEVVSEAERERIIESNNELGTEVCRLMEEQGVMYHEIEIMTKNLGSVFSALMNDACTRANNMGAAVFAKLAEEKLGAPLTVAKLGEEHRRRNI